MISKPLTINTSSASATQEVGRNLGHNVEIGDLILLSGSLGSGKTTLTQGIAWGMGVSEYAHSPTFLLVHVYQGRLPLFHLDLYRLEDLREIEDLDLEDMLDQGVCVIEWAEKALPLMPKDHLSIDITETTLDDRTLIFASNGQRHSRLMTSLSSPSEQKI